MWSGLGKPVVYLAGGINGLTDEQAKGWRTEAKLWLDSYCVVDDPMARDYRGHEDQNVAEIVSGDLDEIRRSHALLVNAPQASWGTAMEMVYAYQIPLPMVVIVPVSRPVSPWLRYHATQVVYTVQEGCVEIKRLLCGPSAQ